MTSVSEPFFLGVDTGASKSHALITDGRGRLLGFGAGGPGNWETIGWVAARATLDATIGEAARQAGVAIEAISAGGFGLAGYDWPEDRPPFERILRELGLRGPLALHNDAFIGLPAGTAAGWGVVVAAGTSCNCYGRDAKGRLGRTTGNSAYGEHAGASELVAHTVRAIARAWTRRGPQTTLSAAFVAAAGAVDVPDLLAGLVRGRYAIDGAAAPLVFAVAEAGDAVALKAVQWAGRGLGDLALGVIRQLNLHAQRFEVVLAGSFFKGSPRLEVAVRETVQAVAPQATTTRLHVPPVAGSVLLAMEQLGSVEPAVRQTLLDELARLTRSDEI